MMRETFKTVGSAWSHDHSSDMMRLI